MGGWSRPRLRRTYDLTMSLTAKRIVAAIVVLVALGLTRGHPFLMLVVIIAGAAASIHPRNPLRPQRTVNRCESAQPKTTPR